MKHAWYRFLQNASRMAVVVLLRFRLRGQSAVPASGPAILLSNHQSHLDPVLIGATSRRRLSILARKTLFQSLPLGWLIKSLGAIPIDLEGSGTGGLREILKCLKRGDVVLIFPEGTRSRDGEIAPLKAGFCALAKRAKVPLVPLALDGAFDAWPRTNSLPRRGTVCVEYGTPLTPAEVAQLDESELLAEVSRRILACHRRAREMRRLWMTSSL